jgi:HEAT repeat protein
MSALDDPLPDLLRALRSSVADSRSRAAKALGRLGWLARDALPALVGVVNDANANVREAAAQAVGQMGLDALPHLTKMLLHEDKYVRRNAVWAIGKLGPLAKSVLPDLCEALHDSDPRTAAGAAQALGNMGADADEAVPALTEAMRGTNIVLCRLAAKALSQIGRPALGTLIAHLGHRDPFVRGEAALALGWMGGTACSAVPALIEVLLTLPGHAVPELTSVDTRTPATPVGPDSGGPSSDATSRAYAAQALGKIGPGAINAVPVLTRAAADTCALVRTAAQQALRQIQA